jgi:hypothetical protein
MGAAARDAAPRQMALFRKVLFGALLSCAAAAGPSTLQLWQQCGGRGGECASNGACADAPFLAACPAGSTCQRQSEE